MANEKFSIKEALNFGWDSFKNHAGFFIGLMVVLGLGTLIPTYVINKLFGTEGLGHALGTLLVRLLTLVFGLFTTRIALNVHDRDDATVPELGTTLAFFFPYLGGKILYALIVILGSFLLIIPGMIWAYMFMYVGFIVVDKGLGPIEALKESKTITYGYKWDLLLFSLVLLLLNLAGFVCLIIGVFVTAPVSMMAGVYVYRRLNPATLA